MLERDKDELRSMGIPVETVTTSAGEHEGYRIRGSAYALEPIDFTLAERAAVALAAQVWAAADIAPVPGTAILKLEAASGDRAPWSPAELRSPVSITSADAALLPLIHAIGEDRVVMFDYRTPDADEPQRRRISPWGLRSHGGRWVVIGHDHDREAARVFRLSRIRGSVVVTADPRIPPPDGFDVRSFASGGDVEPRFRARVHVTPRRAASLRRYAVDEDTSVDATEVTVEVSSVEDLVGLVCAAGADAVVLDPPEAVAAVRDALTCLDSDHAAAP
jgi:proteasome accessory factor B